MAITVGCTDFNQACEFRITANDNSEDLLVDVATAHAMECHPEFAEEESEFREAIRDQIKSLMQQAHSAPSDIAAFR